MQPLSATDAIGPAFTHARTVLASQPFRLSRFFKIALLAAVSQASFLSVSVGYPIQGAQVTALTGLRRAAPQNFANSNAGLAVLGLGLIIAIVVVALLFTLAYVYLIARARAALFDLVVYRGGRVREAWRREARPANRYFGLYLLAMLLFWVAVAAFLGPFAVTFFKAAIAQGSASSNGVAGGLSPHLASQLFLMIGLAWLLIPVWLAVEALLQDFILPGLALGSDASFAQFAQTPASRVQAAPVEEAFRRFTQLLRHRPGQLLLFLILRTVVGLAIGMALGLITLIIVGVLALVAFLIGKLLYGMLWSGGLGARAVFFAVAAAMTLVVGLLYLFCVVAIYGVTGTFKTSYAAYFYSGYYPELAALLGSQPPDQEALVGSGYPGPPSPLPLKARADLPPEVW